MNGKAHEFQEVITTVAKKNELKRCKFSISGHSLSLIKNLREKSLT